MSHSDRPQTLGEEVANAVSHGVGLVASLIGLPILLVAAAAQGTRVVMAGCAVFAGSLILLYAASTLYHAVPHPGAKRMLRTLDHSAIYLLIAGSYTPFALGVLRGAWGWSLFGVVWGLALTGILFKLTLGFRYPRVSVVFYLLMGWLAIVAIRPLYLHLPASGLAWLVTGGLAYTVGVIFYRWNQQRYSHLIWHLFVLAGSACHFWAVLRYALPSSA